MNGVMYQDRKTRARLLPKTVVIEQVYKGSPLAAVTVSRAAFAEIVRGYEREIEQEEAGSGE